MMTLRLIAKSKGSPQGRPNLKGTCRVLGTPTSCVTIGNIVIMAVTMPDFSKARAYSPSTLWQEPQPGTNKAQSTFSF